MLNIFKLKISLLLCVLFFLSGSKWHLHRKLITPTFHFKILEQFFEVFVVKSNKFVNKLKQMPVNNVVDLMPFISKCTLDIICGKRYFFNNQSQ